MGSAPDGLDDRHNEDVLVGVGRVLGNALPPSGPLGDILTSSYPGELYFFKGKGNGEFAAPVKLHRDGKAINLGASSTVFAVDWRGTGRLDLLVGNMQTSSAERVKY
jgi:hypothetical protein